MKSRQKFTTVILQCDQPTASGRVYPKSIMKEAVQKYLETPKNLRLGPITNGMLRLNRVAFEVEDVCLRTDGAVMATIEVLPTTAGKTMISYLENNKGWLIPFGVGVMTETKEIQTYQLLGFSLETEPNEAF